MKYGLLKCVLLVIKRRELLQRRGNSDATGKVIELLMSIKILKNKRKIKEKELKNKEMFITNAEVVAKSKPCIDS